jgi:hypothetical protein
MMLTKLNRSICDGEFLSEEQGWQIDHTGQLSSARLSPKTEKLLFLLKNNDYEPGYTHPGQEYIEEQIQENGEDILQWTQEILTELNRENNLDALAAFFYCLGMLGKKAWPWGFVLAKIGLQHPHADVRSEAIHAIERWNKPQGWQILRHHIDEEEDIVLKKSIQYALTFL